MAAYHSCQLDYEVDHLEGALSYGFGEPGCLGCDTLACMLYFLHHPHEVRHNLCNNDVCRVNTTTWNDRNCMHALFYWLCGPCVLNYKLHCSIACRMQTCLVVFTYTNIIPMVVHS